MGAKRKEEEAEVRQSSSSSRKAPRYEQSRYHDSRSSRRDGYRDRDARSEKHSLAAVKSRLSNADVSVPEKSAEQAETKVESPGIQQVSENPVELEADIAASHVEKEIPEENPGTTEAAEKKSSPDVEQAEVSTVETVEIVETVETEEAVETGEEEGVVEDVPHTPELTDVKCYSPCRQCRLVDEFEKLGRLGEGSYGVVYKARDKRTEEVVALKRIKMHNQETEGFPVSSLREINLLVSLRHPSIVDVREVVVGGDMDSIFMVMEYIEDNLKDALAKSKEPFDHGKVKRMMQQMLDAVAYLHDNWVLHRDIKPSNILLAGDSEVKICDFGLARRYDSPIKVYTYQVVTLWYRAPELLLGKPEDSIKYSTGIDVWSLGCIMAELILKEPLFAGQSEIDQLRKIKKLVSTAHLEKPGFIFPSNKLSSLRDRILYPAAQEGRTMLSEIGLDLLSRMLAYDPEKRISAREALNHPWFDEP